MAKLEPLTPADLAAVLIPLNRRIDALMVRLAAVERHAANPDTHKAAHSELNDLLKTYGVELLRRNEFGVFDPQDVDALYAQVRSAPGSQLPDGTCPAHERTVERLGTLFRHFGWAA